jgi:hypothetical protein
MGQRNLSFIEKNVEKLAIGAGGAAMLGGFVMIVLWAGSDLPIKPGSVSKKAKEVEGTAASPQPTEAGNAVNVRLERVPVLTQALAGFPQAASVDGAGSLAAVTTGTRWTPEEPIKKDVTDGDYPRIVDRYPLPKPDEKRSHAPFVPKVRTPEVTSVVLGRGKAAVPVYEVNEKGTTRSYPAASEMLGAAQIQFKLDLKGTYEDWFEPLYTFVRSYAEAEQRIKLLPAPDYESALKTLAQRWMITVLGFEVQRQSFDPRTGWDKDPAGNDVWKPVEGYGLAGAQDLAKKLQSLNNEFPELPARKDAKGRDKFISLLREYSRLYTVVGTEMAWQTPPGPEAGRDTVLEFYGPGLQKLPELKFWPARPKAAVEDPKKTETPMGGGSETKAGVFLPEDIIPQPKAKDEPKKAEEPKTGTELDPALVLAQRLNADGGPERHFGAIVKDADMVPGMTYRYRVRVFIRNPLFNWSAADPKRDADGKILGNVANLENKFLLASDWSEASAPITVPEVFKVYVEGFDILNREYRPRFRVFRWQNGVWYGTRPFRVAVGSPIRPDRLADLKATDYNAYPVDPEGKLPKLRGQVRKDEEEKYLSVFDTGYVLLEAQEVPHVVNRSPAPPGPAFKDVGIKFRVTFVDSHGVIHTRYTEHDKADLKKWMGK